MRALVTTVLLLVGACSVSIHNRAGPAYGEAGQVSILQVLPAELPARLQGTFTPQDEEQWRRDWPMVAAKVLANGVNHETDGAVSATVVQTPPGTGYYMTTRITYVDVGSSEAKGADEEGWSQILATCRVMNAGSGELVAELELQERAGWLKEIAFEDVMARMGESLGRWFRARRTG
jgi:hypothetical protein